MEDLLRFFSPTDKAHSGGPNNPEAVPSKTGTGQTTSAGQPQPKLPAGKVKATDDTDKSKGRGYNKDEKPGQGGNQGANQGGHAGNQGSNQGGRR